jgi:hypothetical protein
MFRVADALVSGIAWLDFSEDDRRKMMEVVSLFKLRETRDELGLGSIRNVFAELLFPGTGTMQTRARYFLFVPWIYLELERKRASSSKLWDRLKYEEVRLIRILKAQGETDGVIGSVSGASLTRFPSNIYWLGLQRWGIFRRGFSQSQYHRSLDRFYSRHRALQSTDDGEPLDAGQEFNWDPGLPQPPAGFPEDAAFTLQCEEAEYLQERLRLKCRDSMLPFLVETGVPLDQVEFPWMHPALATFPDWLHDRLNHAQHFSEAMYGAALLYNYLLAEIDDRGDLADAYRADIDGWRDMLEGRRKSFQKWDVSAFWNLVVTHGRIPSLTRHFVNQWLGLVMGNGRVPDVIESKSAKKLVQDREVFLKRGRSRFLSKQHRQLWGGSAGSFRLDFRWWVARRLANDIIRGLKGD